MKSSAQERLERLRKKFGDVAGKPYRVYNRFCVFHRLLSIVGLESSMNITPRVAEGADDELVFCEKGEFSLSPYIEYSPKKVSFNKVRRS